MSVVELSSHLTIHIYSHHFAVSRMSPRGRHMCNELARKWAQWGWKNDRGNRYRVMEKVYAARRADHMEYRFHINQLPQFEEMLEAAFITGPLVERIVVPIPESVPVKLKIGDHMQPRENQLESIAYLAAPFPRSKLIGIQTGKGKGYVSMRGAEDFGKRTVVIVPAKYAKKWWLEIVEIYEGLKTEDILLVQGGESLMALLELARSGNLHAKFIIITNATMQIWINEYQELGDMTLDQGYACRPQEFMQFLGAGLRIIDELHQFWHLNFLIDLYTHCERSISLTATLIHKDAFMLKTYECGYPISQRGPFLALDKYIDAFPMYFRFNKPDRIKTEAYGGRGYSHDAFEKSVMRHVPTMRNYFGLIEHALDIGFFAHPRPQKSCLIFCYSTEMCTQLVKYLKEKHPHRDIRRYAGSLKDPFSDLLEGEIVVSTLGSAGTAIDKANLTNVVLTQAVSSIQANVQSFGRLRKIGEGEINQTQFHYFVCVDVPKHVEYDHDKQEVLAERAKSCRAIHTGYVL